MHGIKTGRFLSAKEMEIDLLLLRMGMTLQRFDNSALLFVEYVTSGHLREMTTTNIILPRELIICLGAKCAFLLKCFNLNTKSAKNKSADLEVFFWMSYMSLSMQSC